MTEAFSLPEKEAVMLAGTSSAFRPTVTFLTLMEVRVLVKDAAAI